MDNENVTAKSRYESLSSLRSGPLQRARAAAKLTIPSIMPPEGSSDDTHLPSPHQSIGARGVNNLAAKFLLTLLPPNEPFFKMVIDDFTLEELAEREGARAEVDSALAQYERAILDAIEGGTARPVLAEGLRQLVISGNVLLYYRKGEFRMYRMDKYVVRRDPSGNVMEVVLAEAVSPKALPDDIREEVESQSDEKTVDLYTHIERKPDEWKVYQEANGKKIPESEGTYKLDACPWVPLRFTRVDGEDYGRGYVEEYMGDLKSAEALQAAIVEGSAAAAKVLLFVNPNGVTTVKSVAEAPNGAVRAGRAEDVSVLRLEKAGDFRIALETLRDITQRMAQAFLMSSSVQRSGERVTAEEIRYMASELEDVLGGAYSVLGEEFQKPLVQIVMADLQKRNKIPSLPKGAVEPTVTTGMEALGRGHDLMKLDAFIGGALKVLGPELISTWMSVGDYLTRRATALGMDKEGLIKTTEQVEQEKQAAMQQQQQAAMQQQMMQSGGKMAETAVQEGVKNGSTEQQQG